MPKPGFIFNYTLLAVQRNTSAPVPAFSDAGGVQIFFHGPVSHGAIYLWPRGHAASITRFISARNPLVCAACVAFAEFATQIKRKIKFNVLLFQC